jgi:hypothetical protein
MVATDGKTLDRRQLREHVHAWASTHDPDLLAQRERRAWANRRLSVTADTPNGSVQGTFQLDPIGGATLMAARTHSPARPAPVTSAAMHSGC